MFRAFWGVKVIGAQNVPKEGGFILASNHKSWFDPPIIGSNCPREITYAAKKELFDAPIFGPLIRYLNAIPVKRSGFDREALVKLGQRLGEGGGIIIFPEGTRFLDDQLHYPKAGVGMIALKAAAPIVPVYVAKTAYIRRQILRRQVRLYFGKPFNVNELGVDLDSGKDAYLKIAEIVMQRIAITGGVEPPLPTSDPLTTAQD